MALYGAALPSYHAHKDERRRRKSKDEGVIDASDKRNNDKVRAFFAQIK